MPARDLAAAEVSRELVGEQREGSLVQRDVDGATRARLLSLVQRREDAERRPDAGALVDHRDADAHARATRFPRHAEDAAGSLGERVVARPRAPRPLTPERADGGVHEPRIARARGVRSEAACLGRCPAAGSG